ncbi:MAG: CO2 hydration protein [Synechococcales cyanobacterium RU_4_20]|nr:CO2 hydration protein [Synechococcales cyanobacterium RU_4_20]NJR69871.1 CO2 hydration protein [Synechococcales cyanobacterium CRU_2_2]
MAESGLENSSLQNPRPHPGDANIDRLINGEALLPDTPDNLVEVVGVLDAYGIVLDAYSRNLKYIADHQCLVFFPFFKYFDGEVTPAKWLRHILHDRINYEYAEYCMKAMLWHGDTALMPYLESEDFAPLAEAAIQARIRGNPGLIVLHQLFPQFMPEQLYQMVYYSALGQFWTIMAKIFNTLAECYRRGEITSIPQVTAHIREGLVADAATPITYAPTIRGQVCTLLPQERGFKFISETAVPYVLAVFFKGAPFQGTVSYNSQAFQIPHDPADFSYGALYADPLPVGGSGIPPTLLMQDMSRHVPDYLEQYYSQKGSRKGRDVRVKLAISFQRSMFCVTSATIQGLAPHPFNTADPQEQAENRVYFRGWMDTMAKTRMDRVVRESLAMV